MMSIRPKTDGLGAGQAAREAILSAEFREGMSRVASAVHVITTGGPAGDAGFTATAFTGVADQPGTLLICANQASKTAAVLRENGVFTVNTLAAEAAMVADVFAGRTGLTGEARFVETGDWLRDEHGVPRLASALVSFSCRLSDVREVATHQILIGEVTSIHLGPAGRSLLYRDREYHVL